MADFETGSELVRGTRTNSPTTPPPGIVAGNTLTIVFEIASVGAPPVPTPPAGFVIAPGASYPAVNTDGSFISHIYVWSKVAEVADESAVDFTVLHSNAISGAFMIRSSGGKAVASVTDSTIGQGTGNPATAPGLNVPVAGSLVIWWANYWDPGSVAPPAGANPTFTNRYNPVSGTGLHVATGVIGAAGPTGDKDSTPPGSPWSTGLVLIEAEAAPGPEPEPQTLRPRRSMNPTTEEIVIPTADLTGGSNKSKLFGVNAHSRLTLMVQASANPGAGSYVVRAVPKGSDNTVPGAAIATITFPLTTPNRVGSVTVEIAHGNVYVEQAAALTGATLEKVSLFLQ